MGLASTSNDGALYVENHILRKAATGMGVQLKKIPVNGDRCLAQLVLMGDGEHRLNPNSIAEIENALDEVEIDASICALVTTNEGKFYSNGLDFDFLRSNPDKHTHLIVVFQKLLKRILCFPIPTVAAVCGHAVAGGCMIALAHDYRYMRSDRGFIMLNEVEIKLPLTPGMNAIIKSKLPVPTYHEAVLTAHRYVGKTAAIAGIIHGACPDVDSTREAAIKKASELASRNYDRIVYKALKEEMFQWEVQELLHGKLDGVQENLSRASKL
ncbi:hypothetical protein GOP47_0024452 [Adiantum capillus-veneris]|uniref:Delta(3)-Delta(2)-enoyl-CoA isomerase n=1 Tax=Adiantum capillus-veneris TaxID=13818 RepID=A0A9D4U2B1_ADICA|nr:hypothetical protein GOP47_0024452 [Adiantum capillus-veneris]